MHALDAAEMDAPSVRADAGTVSATRWFEILVLYEVVGGVAIVRNDRLIAHVVDGPERLVVRGPPVGFADGWRMEWDRRGRSTRRSSGTFEDAALAVRAALGAR